MRTEFGAERSKCSCETCKEHCTVMPGFLIPADLERMYKATVEPFSGVDPFQWAEDNLLASPGALVMRDGIKFRIPTLVPAKQPDGSCKHLANGLCQIHEVAPFGCAFFDCHSGTESLALSRTALIEIAHDHRNNGLYSRLWQHLAALGKTQDAPEELRKRYMHVKTEKPVQK